MKDLIGELGHCGHHKNGMYYNGIHHNDVLSSGQLGVERKFRLDQLHKLINRKIIRYMAGLLGVECS